MKPIDKEVVFYQDKFRNEVLDLYEKLPPDERFNIDTAISDVYLKVKAARPTTRITWEDLLITILTAIYFCKFKESPVQTALFAPVKECTDD